MFSFIRFGCLYALLGLAALATLGCTPDLEKNQQFQDERAKLDRVDGEQTSTLKEVGTLRVEVDKIQRDLTTHLKNKDAAASASLPPEALNGLQQRLGALESQVKALQAAQASSAKVAENSKPQGAAAPAASTSGKPVALTTAKPARPANGAKTQVSVVPKATPALTGKAPRSKPTATPSPRPAAPAPAAGGKYYTVVPNDSIAVIASRFHVTAEAILSANTLPPNARLFIGQNIYIPLKGAAK